MPGAVSRRSDTEYFFQVFCFCWRLGSASVSLSGLTLSWFLSQMSTFQNTTKLITTTASVGTQQIKCNNVTDLEDLPKGRALLYRTDFPSDHIKSVSLCVCVWLVNLSWRVTLSGAVHMAWGSRRCLWRASLSTSSSATLPLQQGFPHTSSWIFLWASIANH